MSLKMKLIALCMAVLLSGCATATVVTGAVVGTTVVATKVAVKGTVGAGKLAYRGTKAAVSGTRRLMADDPEPGSIEADRAMLPDPE